MKHVIYRIGLIELHIVWEKEVYVEELPQLDTHEKVTISIQDVQGTVTATPVAINQSFKKEKTGTVKTNLPVVTFSTIGPFDRMLLKGKKLEEAISIIESCGWEKKELYQIAPREMR